MSRLRLEVALTILSLLIAFAVGSQAADLPPNLEDRLDRLRGRLQLLDQRVGKSTKAQLERELAELRERVRQFGIEAELFPGDPILLDLGTRLEEVTAQVASAREPEKSETQVDQRKRFLELRQEIDDLLEIEIDLEHLSFKRDVAPIIADACLRCHRTDRSPGGFNASTFAAFTEGIEPGDPENSHVLALVTGRAEPRMPRGGGRFPLEWAEIWEKWIEQGAKFDGPSETVAITQYLISRDEQRRRKVASLPVDEVERLHRNLGDLQLAIVDPIREPIERVTDDFRVLATLSANDTEYVAALAEATLETLQDWFGLDWKEPVWRGRLSLFAFADRADYVAFAQQVDQYLPESEDHGHHRRGAEHSYIALTVDVDRSMDEIVARQVAAAFLTDLENARMPPWAVHGFSRVIASKVAADSDSLRKEMAEAARLVRAGRSLGALYEERAPWIELAPLGTSFFAYLHRADADRAVEFSREIARTGSAREAFESVIGGDWNNLEKQWSAWTVREGG